MKHFLTVAELAKLRGVSQEYIRRLCRLEKTDPKYIESVKVNRQFRAITDKKILDQYKK